MNCTQYILVVAFFVAGVSLGQTFEVSGRVVNADTIAVPFASVLLLNASDSTLVRGTTANAAGIFTLNKIQRGPYLLKASYIGKESEVHTIVVQENLDSVVLRLANTQQLKEVTVVKKKPTIQRKTDRLVFLVENSTIAEGSAWEVLKNTPGAIVLQDRVEVRGEEATIYINGRRIHLGQEEGKTFLEGLAGTIIQSVEVYNNPPANFDAEEGAVINIITTKSVTPGYKGSVEGRYTQAVFPKFGLGTSHHSTGEKLRLFANYNYNHNKEHLTVGKNIRFMDEDMVTFSNWRTNDGQVKNRALHSANAALDYHFNEKNSLALTTNLLFAPDEDWERNLAASIRNVRNLVDSTFTTRNTGVRNTQNLAFDGTYVRTLNKEGTQLSLNGHYTKYTNDYRQRILSNYFDSSNVFSRQFGFTTDVDQQIEIVTIQTDAQSPLGNASLEAGAKVSIIDSESSIGFFDFMGSNANVQSSLSDDFDYNERIYAAYATVVTNWEKWSVKMGLRFERTDAEGVSLTLDQTNTLDFNELFPTLYILYSANKEHSFSLDYGRRVQRPRYDDLNPFRYFFNENDFEEGNLGLRLNFSNNVNLNYTLDDTYFVDFYYRDNGNYISNLVFQDNDLLTLRELKQNVLGSTSYGVDVTMSKDIVAPWFLYAYTSLFHEDETFLAVESGNREYTNTITGFYVYLGNYLTLSADGSFTGELSFTYMSKNLAGSYIFNDMATLNFGLRKRLWKGRATIGLTAEDILGKANPTYRSRYFNQNNSLRSLPETQFLRLGFSYNFGNRKLEENERDIGKEERERL